MSGILLCTGSRIGSAAFSASYSSEAFESLAKPASGKIKVSTDGNVYGWEGDPTDAYVNQGAWIVVGSASDFEIMMLYVSGDYWETYPAGDDATQSGIWLPVTSDLIWTSSVPAPGGMAGNFTLKVRDKISRMVHDTAVVAYNISSEF